MNVLDWVRDNFSKALGAQAGLSFVNFMANVLMALSDGVITGDEYHRLVSSASSSAEMVVAIAIYWAFKKKDA